MPTSRFEPSSIKNKIKREEIARKVKKQKGQSKLQKRLAQAKLEADNPAIKKVLTDMVVRCSIVITSALNRGDNWKMLLER